MNVLAELRSKGFTVRAEGCSLKVSPASKLTDEIRQQIKHHKPDILAFLKQAPELPPDEEQRIHAWLDYIEEDDRDAIAEVLEKCRRDRDARRYFLERAEEVASSVASVATVAVATPRWVTCGDCAHYRRTDHPHLGHCAAGEPENVAGLWDSDRRVCGRYKE